LVAKAGLYIHIPFCVKRCSYCDFTSCTELNLINPYINALKKEIELRKAEGDGLIFDSIYFGGGTPSILDEDKLEEILDFLHKYYKIASDSEITLEANPESISAKKLKAYKKFKINRLSIGIQSFDDKVLRGIERAHNVEEAYKAVNLARDAGFVNLNIDLIIGLPYSDSKTFNLNVSAIKQINPEHISIYFLMKAGGTKLSENLKRGLISLPDEKSVQFYWNRYINFLKNENYIHYEISNFGRLHCECRHNLHYWLRDPYIGFGVSASSFVNEFRLTNTKNLNLYIEKIKNEKSAITIKEKINEKKKREEEIMLGFRLLNKGVNKALINSAKNGNIERFKKLGLIKEEENFLFLTEKGVLLSNQVISDFI